MEAVALCDSLGMQKQLTASQKFENKQTQMTPLCVITLGHTLTDNINQVITISE